MSAAADNHSDDEPKLKKDNTMRSDAPTSDQDGTSDVVENFRSRNRARKRLIFRGLAKGAVFGVGKAVGENAAEEVKQDLPDIVQWFLDLRN